MDLGALVPELLLRNCRNSITQTESPKVFRCPRHYIAPELDDHATDELQADLEVQEHYRVTNSGLPHCEQSENLDERR